MYVEFYILDWFNFEEMQVFLPFSIFLKLNSTNTQYSSLHSLEDAVHKIQAHEKIFKKLAESAENFVIDLI